PASGYEAWGGTSMATPHVSGVAALLWSANPELTNVQIREAMDMTALDLGDPGRDVHYGYGLVQAYDALDYLIDLKPGKGPKGPKH
ncbi:MAG: S8 family serine peptidase, partial [Anaerolineae bacterium]